MHKLAPDVIALNDGRSGELLLVNGRTSGILLLPEGGDRVLGMLRAMPSDDSASGWADEVRSLLECHHILMRQDDAAAPLAETTGERRNSMSLHLVRADAPYGIVQAAGTYCANLLSRGGTLDIHIDGDVSVSEIEAVDRLVDFVLELSRAESIHVALHLTSSLTNLHRRIEKWIDLVSLRLTVQTDVPTPEVGHPSSHEDYDVHFRRTGALERIRELVNTGCAVVPSTLVTSRNLMDLRDIAEYFVGLNRAAGFEFRPLLPFTSSRGRVSDRLLPDPIGYAQALREIYHARLIDDRLFSPVSELRRRLAERGSLWGCGAPSGHIVAVDGAGEAYPCALMVGQTRYSFGNVADRSSRPHQEWLTALSKQTSVDRIDECTECPWRYLCGGGCCAARMLSRDLPSLSPYAKDYSHEIYCQSRRTLLESIVWSLAREKLAEAQQTSTPAIQPRRFTFRGGTLSVSDL